MSYESHTGRLIDEMQWYVDIPPERQNPIDTGRQLVAGAIHFVTGAAESVVQDGIKKFTGNNDPVPAYGGSMPRTWENATGLAGDMGKLRIGSAAMRIIRSTGDLFADVVGDGVIGGIRRPPVR